MDANRSFGQKAFNSVLMTGIAQAFTTGSQFLLIIIVARFIAPEDFGLIAAVSPVILFVAMFQDIGLQQAVVQRKEITPGQLNRIFWTTALFGVICMVVLCLLSPTVAWFYKDDRLQIITIASSLPILFNSVSSVPNSLMTRHMNFKALSALSVIASLTNCFVTIVSALFGAGYWALVIGPIAMSIVGMAGNFYVSKWLPARPQFGVEKDIFTFGANLTGFNIFNYFARNLDNILIGRYCGSASLGFYNMAYKMLLFPIRSINDPITKVMVPVMSRVQDDKERLRRIYLRTVGLIAFVTTPGMAVATFTAHDVVLFLLGDKWLPIVPIFSWLGLVALLQIVTNSTGWVFISQGKTDIMFKWGVFSSVTTIISFIIGIHWGVMGITIAYVLGGYLRTPIIYYVMGKVGPVKIMDYLMIQGPMLLAAFLTWLVIEFVFRDIWQMHGLVLIAISLCVSYLFAAGISALHPQGRDTLKEGYAQFMKVCSPQLLAKLCAKERR